MEHAVIFECVWCQETRSLSRWPLLVHKKLSADLALRESESIRGAQHVCPSITSSGVVVPQTAGLLADIYITKSSIRSDACRCNYDERPHHFTLTCFAFVCVRMGINRSENFAHLLLPHKISAHAKILCVWCVIISMKFKLGLCTFNWSGNSKGSLALSTFNSSFLVDVTS